MQSVIAISLLFAITLNISLNVINQKNTIIDKQNTQLVENKKQIKTYQYNIKCSNKVIEQKTISIQDQICKINQLTAELKEAKDANKHLKYLGKFKITYYNLDFTSCNKYPFDPAYGHTYSGAIATVNITCAVDRSIINLGSYLYIEGTGCRIAQDTGSKIIKNHIDVYVTDFSYDKYKTHYTNVYLIQ